jgi:FkbM family methyltransferase
MFDELKTRGQRWIARKRRSGAVRLLHGAARFVVDAYDNVEWDLAVNGEASLVRRLAPARFSTVFDVGAHVGDWSAVALHAWPGAHVHAFEVAPPTFARLTSHLDAIGLATRVTLNCIGLSDISGDREMYFYPDHPHLTGLRPWHTHLPATSFNAHLVDGDAYVAEHSLDAIDFIKIDVEGAEHLVLKGLRRTIDLGRLHCVQFEYGAFSVQTRVLLADYYDMLAARYWIGKIYPTHVEFGDYDWTREDFRFANFLCVARTRSDLKLMAEGAAGVRC